MVIRVFPLLALSGPVRKCIQGNGIFVKGIYHSHRSFRVVPLNMLANRQKVGVSVR